MSTFNVYGFIADLQQAIEEDSRTDYTTDYWDYVHQEIDNACMYYKDCFDIVRELHYTDWKDNEFGEITNIQQLAYTALYEYAVDNLEIPA